MTLSDFLKPKAPKVATTVNLLVLRTLEIDSQLENNPDSTLPLVPHELKRIRAALHRLRGQGFVEAVIATDHGFFLNTQAGPGDVCDKPKGNWLYSKDRSLLGQGTADAHNAVLPADKVGIRGVACSYACPKSLAPYRAGLRDFHSGASLQELIVPVLVAHLAPVDQECGPSATVSLTYRNKTGKVTSRLVTVDVHVQSGDLFCPDVELLIEAQDSKGNVVGEARPGEAINPARGTITLKVDQEARVTLKMHGDFEGAFKVKAVHPTTLVEYASLSLKTDYAV